MFNKKEILIVPNSTITPMRATNVGRANDLWLLTVSINNDGRGGLDPSLNTARTRRSDEPTRVPTEDE